MFTLRTEETEGMMGVGGLMQGWVFAFASAQHPGWSASHWSMMGVSKLSKGRASLLSFRLEGVRLCLLGVEKVLTQVGKIMPHCFF